MQQSKALNIITPWGQRKIEYKAYNQGKQSGIALRDRGGYGWVTSPLGVCFIAAVGDCICCLSLPESEEDPSALANLKNRWRSSEWNLDNTAVRTLAGHIFNAQDSAGPLKLLLKGTAFQHRVWRQLLTIPMNQPATYSEIALAIGTPKAVRAVGNAVSENPIGLLIPCHRVLRKDGSLGGYRWGTELKQKILSLERNCPEGVPS